MNNPRTMALVCEELMNLIKTMLKLVDNENIRDELLKYHAAFEGFKQSYEKEANMR